MPAAKRSPTAQNDSEASTPAPKTARKPNRPRIDAIVNAIGRGDYDDKLKNLRDAIDKRNEARRADVLALVHEVYGDGVTITQPRMPIALARDLADLGEPIEDRARSAKSNPFVEKAREAEAEPPESEMSSITSSSESVQVVRGPDDGDLDGDGTVTVVSTGDGDGEIISNSPTIS